MVFSLSIYRGKGAVKFMRRLPSQSGVLTLGVVENLCHAGAKRD